MWDKGKLERRRNIIDLTNSKEKLFVFLMTQKSSQLLIIFQDKSASNTSISNLDICTQCSDTENNIWLYLTGFRSVGGQKGKLLKWEIDVIIKEVAPNGVTQCDFRRKRSTNKPSDRNYQRPWVYLYDGMHHLEGRVLCMKIDDREGRKKKDSSMP